MEAVNRAHFDAEAAAYERKAAVARAAGAAAARIAAEHDLTGKTCLDLGCGTGFVSQHLAPLAAMTYGLDVSPAMAAAYNAKAAGDPALRGRMRAAAAAVWDAAALEAAQAARDAPGDGTVKVAWVQLVLHHVDDCQALFAGAARLLAPGASVFVTDLLKTPESHLFHTASAHHAVAHPGGFSEAQLQAVLAPAGLRLTGFDPRAFEFEKEVDLPDGGGKRGMSFPLFFARAVKGSGCV